jgi:hypothetical protein
MSVQSQAVGRSSQSITQPRRRRRWLNEESLTAFFFVLPSLIGFTAFYAVPAVRGLWISFTNWDLLRPAKFIGIENYVKLFQDKEFWNAISVTVYYVLLNIPLQTDVGDDHRRDDVPAYQVDGDPGADHSALADAAGGGRPDLAVAARPEHRHRQRDAQGARPADDRLSRLTAVGHAVDRHDQHLGVCRLHGAADLRRLCSRSPVRSTRQPASTAPPSRRPSGG